MVLEGGRWNMEPRTSFDWTKPFRTRGGSECRIYTGDANGNKPVHGAYSTGTGEWIIASWNLSGRYLTNNKKTGLDLVNDTQKEAA